jgi:hypothetical protein
MALFTLHPSLLPEGVIHIETDSHTEEPIADMKTDLSVSLGNNLSDILGNYPSVPQPSAYWHITSMQKLMVE